MTLADSIYAYLSARSAVTSLVPAVNIYHVDTLDQSPDPALYYEQIGDDRPQSFAHASPVDSIARVSFEAWSASQATAEAIGAVVYAAFMNPNGSGSKFSGALGSGGVTVSSVHFEGSRPLYQDDPRRFGREIDITFFHQL